MKHNIDTSNVKFLKENYLDTLKKLPFKPNWESCFRPIQFKLFTKNNDLIFQYSSCEGALKHTEIYNSFPPKNITPIDSTYTLTDEQRIINENISNEINADYIAIIYWATYTGIPCRIFFKKIEKVLKEKNENIIILLNTDNIEYE